MRGRFLVALWVFLVGGSSARAATDIQPPFVTVTAEKTVETVTVTNDRGVAAGYEIEALGWEQKADGEVLLPATDGIRVEPASLDIAPHGRAEIRVTTVAPPPKEGEAEKVYRIRIRERPDRPREDSEQQIQMIATVTLPVFQVPPRAAPQARLEAGPLGKGRLSLAVVNDGTAHTYVREVTMTGQDAKGNTVFSINRNGWYVLAHGRLEFAAALSARDCRRSSTLAMTAHPLEGDEVWSTTITPDHRQCGRGKDTEFSIPGMVRLPAKLGPARAPPLSPPTMP